jgi:acylphosphatase
MRCRRVHAFIVGVVQGVGFRFAAQRKAREMGLTGWVKNTPDGRVEILSDGPSEKQDQFLEWCREGPSRAVVERIDIQSDSTVDSGEYTHFEIRHSV